MNKPVFCNGRSGLAQRRLASVALEPGPAQRAAHGPGGGPARLRDGQAHGPLRPPLSSWERRSVASPLPGSAWPGARATTEFTRASFKRVIGRGAAVHSGLATLVFWEKLPTVRYSKPIIFKLGVEGLWGALISFLNIF